MGARRGKSGQVAMEYLLITALGFVLIIPIVLIAYSQSAAFTQDVSASQIQKVGSQIIDGVNAVYYAGPPAKKTIILYFPEHIKLISLRNTTLLFTVEGSGGTYEYATFAATNMTGNIQIFSGTHTIVFIAQTTSVNITDG